MECPKCRLISPPDAARCDCGYDFETGTIQESYVSRDFHERHPNASAWMRERGRRDVKTGAICLAAVALAAIVSSFEVTRSGGTYTILYLPGCYGVFLLGRGVYRIRLARTGIEWKSDAMALLGSAAKGRFRAGQVWRYRCRTGEEASRAVVGRVDETAGGLVIVHVQLTGLKIPNAQAPSGYSTVIHHVPIAAEQMAASVLDLESDAGALDEFKEAYTTWREAYEVGRAGVFAVQLAETVDLMERISPVSDGRRGGEKCDFDLRV